MASIQVSGADITFIGSQGDEAVARNQITGGTPDELVTFTFSVERNGVFLAIGTAAGLGDILGETFYPVGFHIVSVTPTTADYVIDICYRGLSRAVVRGFTQAPAGALNMQTPWGAQDLSALRWTQDLNVQWWADGVNPVQVLERRAAASWSLRELRPDSGPFERLNLSGVTLTPSAQIGEVTITASAPIFTQAHAGSLLKIVHTGQTVIETLSAVDQVTDTIRVSGIDNQRRFTVIVEGAASGDVIALERSIGNELNFQSTGQTYSSNRTFSFNDSLDQQVEFDNVLTFYRLRLSASGGGSPQASMIYSSGLTEGTARIASVEADNSVTADVIAPFAQRTGASLWAFGSWGGIFGYPKSVALEDGRLWLLRGNTYWFSGSDDFEDFEIGTFADQAGSRTVPGRMGTIQWSLGVGGRVIGGFEGFEAAIGTGRLDDVITPATVRADVRSNRGSADHQAVLVDDHAVAIARNRTRLYGHGFDGERQNYKPFHITLNNRDLGRIDREANDGKGRQVRFVELAYQFEPEPRLWIVRTDGQLIGIVYDIEEGVLAPFRIKIQDAEIKSVMTLPSNDEDVVAMVVRRIVDGSPVTTIERLSREHWVDIRGARRLHSSITYIDLDNARTVFDGLEHLEGLEVYCWGDGRSHGPFTVTNGEVTLDIPVYVATIGRAYSGRWKSARLSGAIADYRKIDRLSFIVYRTAGGSMRWGDSFDPEDMNTLADEFTGVIMPDQPIALVTEDKQLGVLGTRTRDSRLHVEMHTPGPVTVLGLAPHVDIDSR